MLSRETFPKVVFTSEAFDSLAQSGARPLKDEAGAYRRYSSCDMVREPSDAERSEFAPVVRVLLQMLLTRLGLPTNRIERRLIDEAARAFFPSSGSTSLAVGRTYDDWAELVGAEGASIRPAFSRLAAAAAECVDDSTTGTTELETTESKEKALRASFTREKETASGRLVLCTLTVVRPGEQKNGAAGFEVSVVLDGEEISERVQAGPLKRRETKATIERREAIERVATTLKESRRFRTALMSLRPEILKRPPYLLYEFGRLEIVLRVRRPPLLRRLAPVLFVLFLLVAGSALAHPKVWGVVRETVTAVWSFVTGAGHRPAPRPTPTPRPVPTPQPTPTPAPPFEVIISVDDRPGPSTAPSGERNLTANEADGDPTEAGTATKRLGTLPWLYVARTKACGPCVSVLAYPALRAETPLRFRVNFGDGSPSVSYDTLGARLPERGGRMRESGVYYPDKPGWEQVFVLKAGHTYPVEDAPYVVTVTVEPITAGAPASIVVLRRKIRIETFGVVATEATITVPTPAPTSP